MRRRLLLVAGLLVLLTGAGLQLFVVQYYTDNVLAGQEVNTLMRGILAGPAYGWSATDQQLGETEFYRGAVRAELNLDDFVYRTYSRSGATFSVFVAYWRPNKMPTNLVASHTPDRCWAAAGWICDKYDLQSSLDTRGVRLQPAYWRLFHVGKQQQHVLYWHLVGGRAQIYGGNTMNRVTSWRYWWKEAAIYGLQGNEEQYFIRVTSDRPFEEIWRDAGFQDVLGRLAALGLAAR
jgi:hypothetical protein